MSSAWLSAAIVEFEQVTLNNGTELFRVRARGRRGDDPEPRPLLITREGDAIAHTYEPLSSGGDRRGLLRLAYTVPTERVGPSTAFSLQLPDGYRIELPEPTPGESRTDPEDVQRLEDDEPGWEETEPAREHRDSPEPGGGAAQRIAELEQELGELRSSSGELSRRLAELTAEHEQAGTAAARDHDALESLRGSHGAVEEELRSTRESVAHALSELELAHAERDAARRDAESARAERDTAQQAAEAARIGRDNAPQTTGEDRDENARLTGQLRQLRARIELLRADATAARPGSDPRLRRLESEREQLITHVRALAELLSIDGRAGDAGDAAKLGDAVTEGASDRLETVRARAVREANEDAERELRRLRAGTPR